tara:strand:- start:1157 stop:1681 length:525 start_codon:yes stop_codon:yes gene_type:complete
MLDRIARITASGDWGGEINPTQRAALSYLTNANRFSRSPSQVADYLSATRGTVSQTLKALARKGLVHEIRSELDKRTISYDVTEEGHAALNVRTVIDNALSQLSETKLNNLSCQLSDLIRQALMARGGRSFGVCRTCRHHRADTAGAFCLLLNEPLLPAEADLICHEHEPASQT